MCADQDIRAVVPTDEPPAQLPRVGEGGSTVGDDQPDVAPGPDVDAGGAGDEVFDATDEEPAADEAYLVAARAYLRVTEVDEAPEAVAEWPWLVALVDDVLESGEAEIERFMDRADSADYQRDVARRDLAEAIRERDEARAKTDGGEWTTAYGDSDLSRPTNPHAVEWCEIPACDNDDGEHDRKRRVWLGPVEPVTDDGSAT